VTLVAALSAIAIHAVPGAANLLQYNRAAVAEGQLWQLWTGHFTHWDNGHLFWDLLMFVVLGALIEARSRAHLLKLVLGSALAISLFAWFQSPELPSYRGLSGVDTALFVFVACGYLLDAIRDRQWMQGIIPAGLLLSAMGKFSYEALTRSTLFVDSHAAGFTVVIEAHLVGMAVGAIFAVSGWLLADQYRALPPQLESPA
jgi:rhomboid family GlyGly-CTERM serine protease